MQAILMAFALCLLGVMVTMLIFTIAMWPDEEEEEAGEELRTPVTAGQFFAEEAVAAGTEPSDSLRATMLELEEHVRREREAARLFLQGPSAESLHAPSDSPLWH